MLILAGLTATAGILLPRRQALAAAAICVVAMWLVVHPAAARRSPILGILSHLYREASFDVHEIGRLTPLP